MEKFNAILVEGLFYEKGDSIYIERDDGEHVLLDDVLAPVDGQRVQLALHHLPPNGIQAGDPGAGSCCFPGGVGCPVRHDLHPDRLLSFHLEGMLKKGPWRLEKFDGSVQLLPLAGMPGHYGRVGAATTLDVGKMREQLASMNPESIVEALATSGVDAGELKDMLARLRGGG